MTDVSDIKQGIAAYIGCDPDEVTGFVLAFEYVDKEANATHMHSMWNGYPTWHLTGFAEKLKRDMEQKEAQAQIESMLAESNEDGQI